MQHPNYLTPRLDRHPVVILMAWWLLQAGFYGIQLLGRDDISSDWELYLSVWLIGAVYGVAATTCWMATSWKNVLVRYVIRILIAAVAAALLTVVGTANWLRHIANLGGLLVIQCILFFLLGLPSWRSRGNDLNSDSVTAPRRQFRIADVMIATTTIALLLGTGLRYTAPIDSFYYWLVSLVVWFVAPLIAASLFVGLLSRNGGQLVVLLIVAAVITTATVVGLAWAEFLANERAVEITLILPMYACLMSGFAANLLVGAIAARVSGGTAQRNPADAPPAG